MELRRRRGVFPVVFVVAVAVVVVIFVPLEIP